MNYPIVIHKDPASDYGVTVPDLPGCFSAGSTLDEALAMAREAVELHLEGLIEDGQPVPPPSRAEDHRGNPDYRGGIWAIVQIDPGHLRLKAKRINITVPERILDAIDRTAQCRTRRDPACWSRRPRTTSPKPLEAPCAAGRVEAAGRSSHGPNLSGNTHRAARSPSRPSSRQTNATNRNGMYLDPSDGTREASPSTAQTAA